MNGAPAPWYRQFWAWFVIAPPLAAVLAGVATVVIATQNADSLVVGDFDRVGLGYRSAEDRLEAARERAIGAELALPEDGNGLRLTLQGEHGGPQRIQATLAHATQGERDQRLTLVRVDGGGYEGRLQRPLEGRQYVVLEPAEGEWRLEGRLAEDAGALRLGAADGAR